MISSILCLIIASYCSASDVATFGAQTLVHPSRISTTTGITGQILKINSSGVYAPADDTGGAGAAYPFTPTSHFGSILSATSTSIFATGSAGFYASSTSILSTTTVQGALNIGTLTATSGTSWINALNLGTALADTYVADDITLTNITQVTNRSILDTTGTLTVARGGTGQTTFSVGQLLYGSGTDGISTVATGSVSGTNGITVTAGRA